MSFTKYFILTTLFLLALFNLVNAQSNTWINFYGTPMQDGGRSVRQTYDNGFILGGYNLHGGPAPYYYHYIALLKTDSLGNEIWNKLYGPGICKRIEITEDNGFLIFAGDRILKTNSSGQQIWVNSFETSSAYSGCITSDDGIIVVGRKDYNLWIMKCDSLGNHLWTKTYENNFAEGRCIQATSDSGYIITGRCCQNLKTWLLKLDSQGDTTWTRTFNGIYGDYIDECNNGDFIITGFTEYKINDPENILLMRTNSDGNLLWEKRLGKGSGNSVRQTKSGEFILTGGNTDLSTLNLINTDSAGNSKFIKTYDPQLLGGTDVIESNDGGYVVVGTGYRTSSGYDICLLKTDSLGNVANFTSISDIYDNTIIDYELIHNYPNPFNSVTLITYKVQKKSNITLSLYDILGRRIKNLFQGIQDIGEHNFILNADDLSSGIYFIRMETKTQSFMRKCILIK